MRNTLFFGDNLEVLRGRDADGRPLIADESVDLIYLDPPFNSAATYNVLFKAPDGGAADSQIEAFEDTWHWGDSAVRAYEDVLTGRHGRAAVLLKAMRDALGENDMMAYLAMMAARLVELHRVLKPTGSLYLHCDPTASHYLKILLDGVFGAENFRSEIVWKRTSGHSDAKRYGPAHDTILFYSKSDKFLWNDIYQPYDPGYVEQYYRYKDENGRRFMSGDLSAAGLQGGGYTYDWKGVTRVWRVPESTMQRLQAEGRIFVTRNGIPRMKRYLDEAKGMPVQDLWTDIEALRSWHAERLSYPTQKPLALLERIISASSNPGDVVLDPFCGCGTAVHAAEKLGRRWLGIDVTHLAIGLVERRLKDAFPGIVFDVQGTPRDIASARNLAERSKHQFQWWAVSLVEAVPQGGSKKGADRGIDGIRWVRTGPREGDLGRVIVSVKGGENVGVKDVRDLVGTVEREKALGGVLVTLAAPTKPMMQEAASHGFASTGLGQFRKIMVKTVEELMRGVQDDAERLPPLGRGEGFRAAPRERGKRGEQSALDL